VYDEESRIWIVNRGKSLVTYPVNLVCGILGIVLAIVVTMFMIPFTARSAGLWVMAAINLVSGPVNILIWYSHRFVGPKFVATVPDGFWFSGRFEQTCFRPWSEIQTIRHIPSKLGNRAHLEIILRPYGRVVPFTSMLSAQAGEAAQIASAHIARARSAIWNAKDS